MPKQIVSTAKYVRSLFQDSLITGVPQIVETKNVARKVLKSAVLLACLIGFIYQTTEFLKIFWSFPTVLDIDVEYPEIIESPAITFCNLNGVKRTSFCEKFPDSCDYPKNPKLFCKAFPDYCDWYKDGNIRFPVDKGLFFEHESNFKDLKDLGHASNDTLPYCLMIQTGNPSYVKCSLNDTIHMSMSDGNSGYRNCYSLFSNINNSVLNRYVLPVPKKKDALFHMAFDVEAMDYFRPDRQVGVMIAIHSPNSVINPFFDGFVIKPGNLYTVHLKAVEEKLLPSPYETQCKDYKAMWIMRGGRGPLSQEMCLAECVYNVSLEQCNCIIPDILYPHKDRICTDDEMDCFDFNLTKCYDVCPQPCDFTDFEYDVQERKLEDSSAISLEDLYKKDTIAQSRSVVLIFLKRPEIIVYSHRPQYEDIEVFSFMGGYVGMWLGISLIGVFDFFESVVLIINFWIRKRLLKNTE